jgi:flavin-dependent dehydrogenase
VRGDAVGEVREFDVVVVGAGPAGEVCAGRLAEAGLELEVWLNLLEEYGRA